MATFTEIAAHAGISIAAVSRAYTPGASISAKMLAKISLAAKQLDHPLPPLPLIGLGLPPLEVGIVVGQIPSIWQDSLVKGLNQAANQWNVQLQTISAHHMAQNPKEIAQKIDGFLVLNGTQKLHKILEKIGKPWVETLCLKEQQATHKASIITIDHLLAGQALARHLIERHYQCIYLVFSGDDTAFQRQIFRGMVGILDRSTGIKWQQVRLDNPTPNTITTWIDTLTPPDQQTAYCTLESKLSIMLRRGLEQNGRRLPQDGGLICLSHNSHHLEDTSRLVLPLADMMNSAVELLRGQIIDQTRSREIRLLSCNLFGGRTLNLI